MGKNIKEAKGTLPGGSTVYAFTWDEEFQIARNNFGYPVNKDEASEIIELMKIVLETSDQVIETEILNVDYDIEELRIEHEKRVKASKTPAVNRDLIESNIYLMSNRRNGLTKIGISQDPKHREKTLQSQEPEIDLIYTMAGNRLKELKLHEYFAEKRIRGEWFDLTEEDIESIKVFFNSAK